jgi:hypothetical protein
MSSDRLNRANSEYRAAELRRQAERWRLAHRGDAKRQTGDARAPAELVIRLARAEDDVALGRLAMIDGHPPIDGSRWLVAAVEEEVLAALPLDGGDPLADPFRPTASLVEMLKLRAGQLRGDAPARRGLRARLSRLLRPAGHGPPASAEVAPRHAHPAPATPGNARMLIRRD